MLMIALPMLTGLLPVYDFVAAKVDEYDPIYQIGMNLGVVLPYHQQACLLLPWKLKKEGTENRFLSLMHEWRGREKRLVQKLSKQRAEKKKKKEKKKDAGMEKEKESEKATLCQAWHESYVLMLQQLANKSKAKEGAKKDDVFYQYQQRKQKKKALLKEVEREKGAKKASKNGKRKEG